MQKFQTSVALCTYNGEHYLARQLDSIFAQTRVPDEVVICDDNSCDSTRQILNHYKSKHPLIIRLFHNDINLGYVKNFERAIRECVGSIILLCDQDDVWKCDRVERSMVVFEDNPDCGYVFSDANLIDDNGQKLDGTLWKEKNFTTARWNVFQNKYNQPKFLYPINCVTGATLAFRSKYRKNFLPIPLLNAIRHDGWIAIILSLYGNYGIALKEPLIDYRIHSQQQIGVCKITKINNLHNIFVDHRNSIKHIIVELTTLKRHIEQSRNQKAIYEFHRSFGQFLNDLKIRFHLLTNKSRLERIIPIIKHYHCGGYMHFTSPRLSVLKDLFR